MFSLCIMWHTSIMEKSLRTAVFDPVAQREAGSFACLFRPLFLYCHGGNRGRVSRVACGWETTAGCPARRQGCCCKGVGGAVIISFVSVRVDNRFCPH